MNNRSVLLSAALAALSLSLCASENPFVPLWPEGKIPLFKEVGPEGFRPIKDDVGILDNVSVPGLVVTKALEGRNLPAVVVCPGGGYGILAWNHEGIEVTQWLKDNGLVGVILKYRVPDQRDAALADAQRAIRWVRAHAKELNVDPHKVGIMGFSAGANLTVRTSTNWRKPIYEPVDDVDRESCRPDFQLPIYPWDLILGDISSPEPLPTVLKKDYPVDAETPPAFIVQSEDDRVRVENGWAYHFALDKAGVENVFRVFRRGGHGGHGYGVRKLGFPTDAWPAEAMRWMKRRFGLRQDPPRALDPRPQAPNEKYARYYMQRHNWFVEHKAEEGEGAVVFLGDSITEGYAGAPSFKRAFRDPATRAYKGFNLGYDGDRTENVLWRIWNGQLDGYRARAVVLLIGTNNLANGYPEGDVLEGIGAILSLIREKQPQARIILSALLPRGGKDDPLRAKEREWNVDIERLALNRGIRCINVWDRFLDADGNLGKGLFGDGLHPSAAGYEIWTDALLSVLKEEPGSWTLDGLEDVAEKKDATRFTIRDAGDRVAFRFEVKDDTVCTVKKPTCEYDLAYGDRVEVYFSPNEEKTNGYVCVEIDSTGRPLDYHVTAGGQFEWDWNFKTLKCAGKLAPGGYVVDGSVAKAELAEYGVDVRKCWIGVFRADCPEDHGKAVWYSAMPMAPRPHFHRAGMLFPLFLSSPATGN